jgi:hypothetical protein
MESASNLKHSMMSVSSVESLILDNARPPTLLFPGRLSFRKKSRSASSTSLIL